MKEAHQSVRPLKGWVISYSAPQQKHQQPRQTAAANLQQRHNQRSCQQVVSTVTVTTTLHLIRHATSEGIKTTRWRWSSRCLQDKTYIKGQFWWFLTLSPSIWIRDIMWNWDTASNLLFFLKLVMSLIPGRTSNCSPLTFPLKLQASQRHVCFERTFWLWQTKNPLLLKITQ